MPREVAKALLSNLPQRSVLFVAGDNDTYPLWYAQQVEHTRRDVTVVTLPLLAAGWYGDELDRRDSLGAAARRRRERERGRGERAPHRAPGGGGDDGAGDRS